MSIFGGKWKGGELAKSRGNPVGPTVVDDDMLRKELRQSCNWMVCGGITYLNIPVVVKNPACWIQADEYGYPMKEITQEFLRSETFAATNAVHERRMIAILGSEVFSDQRKRKNPNIFAKAEVLGFRKAIPQIACTLSELLTSAHFRVLGFNWITVMHDPFWDEELLPNFIAVERGSKVNHLTTYCVTPEDEWDGDGGFAFEVPMGSLA